MGTLIFLLRQSAFPRLHPFNRQSLRIQRVQMSFSYSTWTLNRSCPGYIRICPSQTSDLSVNARSREGNFLISSPNVRMDVVQIVINKEIHRLSSLTIEIFQHSSIPSTDYPAIEVSVYRATLCGAQECTREKQVFVNLFNIFFFRWRAQESRFEHNVYAFDWAIDSELKCSGSGVIYPHGAAREREARSVRKSEEALSILCPRCCQGALEGCEARQGIADQASILGYWLMTHFKSQHFAYVFAAWRFQYCKTVVKHGMLDRSSTYKAQAFNRSTSNIPHPAQVKNTKKY